MMSIYKTLVDKMSMNKMPIDKMSVNKMSIDKMSVNKFIVYKNVQKNGTLMNNQNFEKMQKDAL